MENYEQKYKEALERAKVVNPGTKDYNIVTTIFPELKKSEDELIREELINFLEVCQDTHLVCNSKKDKWIDWLRNFNYNANPKFKVGDWVVFNTGGTYQVEKNENYEYTLRHILGGSMPLPFCSENLIKLWTIQDAKDGDMLYAKPKNKDGWKLEWLRIFQKNVRNESWSYCSLPLDSHYDFLPIKGYIFINEYDFYPATKEQRDFLFARMKEAGYGWNSNKEKLIRYEQ